METQNALALNTCLTIAWRSVSRAYFAREEYTGLKYKEIYVQMGSTKQLLHWWGWRRTLHELAMQHLTCKHLKWNSTKHLKWNSTIKNQNKPSLITMYTDSNPANFTIYNVFFFCFLVERNVNCAFDMKEGQCLTFQDHHKSLVIGIFH